MASSGSKKSKTKWKAVDASQIIDSKAPRKVTASWADDSNNDLDDSYDYGRKTDFPIVLPTAPRAARGPENDANIPKEPPFQLYVSNLPYEMTEDDLAEFFSNLRVKSVKIPKDDRGNTKGGSKGYGYVEFEDRESLIEALSIPDTTYKGRRIRISVADNSDQGRGGRGGMSDRGPNDPDRTMGDWRSGPRSDPEPSDRDGFRSGPRRDFNNSEGGMFGDRDRRGGGFRDDDRGGFRNRDGYRDNRGGGFGRDDRSGGGFRDERGGSSFRDRGGDRGGFRDNDSDRFERRGFDDKRSDYGGGGGSSWRRDTEPRQERNFDDKVRDEMAPSGEPKTRTRLNLQPRTKPVEETKSKEDNRSTPAQATASIFGGAKPVDTAAREREIEDRLNKQRESGPQNESKSGVRDSIMNKEISSSRDETSASSLEPAPPPRENAWAKRTNSQTREVEADQLKEGLGEGEPVM